MLTLWLKILKAISTSLIQTLIGHGIRGRIKKMIKKDQNKKDQKEDKKKMKRQPNKIRQTLNNIFHCLHINISVKKGGEK